MDETDRFLEQVEGAILDLLRAQVAWHKERGSLADWRKLVDIAEKHVGQRLDLLMARHDSAGRAATADAIDAIQSQLLPELAARLRSRH